jgi:hypothetical protein
MNRVMMGVCFVAMQGVMHADLDDTYDRFVLSAHEAGVAIYKEHDFYSNDLADVIRFVGFTDRRTKDSSGKGYLQFILADGGKINVPARNMIAMVLDKEIEPPDLSTSDQLEAYKSLRVRILQLTAINSPANALLSPDIAIIDANLRHFETGDKKSDGHWITPEMAAAERVRRDEIEIRKSSSQIQSDMASCYDLSNCEILRGEIDWLAKQPYADESTKKYLADVVADLGKRLDAVQAPIEAKDHREKGETAQSTQTNR